MLKRPFLVRQSSPRGPGLVTIALTLGPWLLSTLQRSHGAAWLPSRRGLMAGGGSLQSLIFFAFNTQVSDVALLDTPLDSPPPIPLPLLANKDTPLEEDLSEAEEEMVKAEG